MNKSELEHVWHSVTSVLENEFRTRGWLPPPATIDQSSPSPLQAPHNPGERLRNSDVAVGEGETPPVRQENDDVFKGFRGNNEA
jgi:hypothetical protein